MTYRPRPGERVYRWTYTGTQETATGRIDTQDVQPLTVVRVNRVTVTVRNDRGDTFRIDPDEIEGPWTY